MDGPASQSYANVKVLVTGATGFIGRWVTRALVAEGASVAVVAREPGRCDPDILPRIHVLQANLANPGELASAVSHFRPSIVFNLAGYGVARTERDEITSRHVNMHVVSEAIEAIQEEIGDEWRGPRLVQAGSALEYGSIQEPLDENAQPLPTTTYGQTKLAATTILQHARDEVSFPSVSARLFTVFGPGERSGRLFPTLVAAASTSRRIPLSIGTQSRDWVYVEDAAAALLRLGLVHSERILSGLHPFDAPAINVASGNLTSVREFVLAAAKALGIATSRLGFGDVPQLPEEMFHGPVPVARLQAALGWLPPADPAPGLARGAAVAAQ
jgi:nucleoside-diphosphate-sugar epimerase